jgi:predicted O-methyltransferase YrrM
MRLVFNKLKSKIAQYLYAGNYPPGHYYSPIPDRKYVRTNEMDIFNSTTVKDVDLNEKMQLEFLKTSLQSYKNYPFPKERNDSFRYYSENPFFNYTDSLSLFFVLDRFKPKRIVEVGSGFSSACMLDVFDKHLKYQPHLTFIEPYPDRLKTLLGNHDTQNYRLLQCDVQGVSLSVYNELEENDILFIDSSHVSKVGSDLNHILFHVLPALRPGVIIHFHDICFPFEYPKEWIYDGIYWNEAYLVRAFLMNNSSYEVLLFNNFIWQTQTAWLTENIPTFHVGGSLYLKKK